MNEETLRVLEYDKVKTLLAGFTATEPGAELARALRPLAAEEVAEALAEVDEMMTALASFGRPPVGGAQDLRESLRQLRAQGAWLAPAALLEVLASIQAAQACRRYFAERQQLPRLTEQARGLAPLKELGRELGSSIGARGEILDSASFELGEIRRETVATRSRIRRTLESLLAAESLAGVFQERLVTDRGGRYVVPVRADHRGQIKGFVHDESASGQTLFLEPTAVLETNNRLQSLLREEKREEEKILRRLSDQVRREAEALAVNQRILARFDFLAAAAGFSRRCEATVPQLSGEPLLELRGARHPLLLVNPDGTPRMGEAIPVDLLLGGDSDTLVISGPNTGGKTVALKTVGLLLLMVCSGLPIPCQGGSRVHLFRRLFADIGDEQSIEANLSTFSGHLSRIRRILEEADGDSLVLLDEAGTGTDPAEGGALALAVLDSLRGRGARTVVTTHLNLIKGYAHLQQGVENAAVEFDSTTLAPTYRLHYGIPGASNAFTIARLLGLPEEVLARAGDYLGEGEREGLELIEELNRLRKELVEERTEVRRQREEARLDRQRRRQLLQELEEQKRTLLEKTARRGEEKVRQAERNLQELLRRAAETTAVTPPERAAMAGALQAVRQDVARLKPEAPRRGPVAKASLVGEILRIPALDAEGEVVRIAGEAVELSVRGKKLRLPLRELEQFVPRRFAGRRGPGKVHSQIERQSFEPRLLLVGERVDAALPRLDRFLDDALLHGLRQVEVVHGAGEGILRRAVRDFLAGHREVTAFRAGEFGEGGDNVTVVELRGE